MSESTAETRTTLVIVEDDAMVRSWIRLSLGGSEFAVVGEATGVAEVADLVARRVPDILLIDFRLGDGAGTELVRALRVQGVTAQMVLMTAHYQPGFNEAAREAGAQGSVLKTGSADELLDVLRAVRDGVPAFDARHPRRDPNRAALSPRERAVLRLLAAGKTNKQVADELQIAPETVKTLVSRTFAKLGAKRRAEAVATAQRMGLL